jgi:hypothetical protein
MDFRENPDIPQSKNNGSARKLPLQNEIIIKYNKYHYKDQ